MKKLVVGILAHVDAGKTTLLEGLLYQAGVIRTLGRVDNRDSFLDTDALERKRGITIFSKQAILETDDVKITLLDTPGHIDFSAEMERTLWVMDYAILVISASDGMQGHTLTLWRLLKHYQIPVFIFINKMDQMGADHDKILNELLIEFGDGVIDFTNSDEERFYEEIAVCDEQLLEQYLNTNQITKTQIIDCIENRKIFPCYFGSALKMDGIVSFLSDLFIYTKEKSNREKFAARVFKVVKDVQGNRLTYMKITGGKLKVKDKVSDQSFLHKYDLDDTDKKEVWEEKVNQIRVYSGEKFKVLSEVEQGDVCAVVGFTRSYPGEGLGEECDVEMPLLEPVLTYTLIFPDEVDSIKMFHLLKEIEEEQPELEIMWQEETNSIEVKLMGEVQIDILKEIIWKRFQIRVDFGEGKIVYKETIKNKVEGIGHFEPLRHYAEVHLLLEPGERGSGMQFFVDCSEDVLDKNWQRLIMTHLEEKEHIGVLTGSILTDVRITVIGGKAHQKHTEGGDFRQASYRAVRQGLMQADSLLLEPYYSFRLEVPNECIGRAMTDIENMYGKFEPPIVQEGIAVLKGVAPVATMQGYMISVNSYTKGKGFLFCNLSGYDLCHNQEEVVKNINYSAESDVAHPASSVFCAHGAGFMVPWDEVQAYMHVETEMAHSHSFNFENNEKVNAKQFDYSIDDEQIEEILSRTFRANENASKGKKVKRTTEVKYRGHENRQNRKKYLIVDGYNILNAWDDLKCLLHDNLDGARMKLMDILSNYQGYVKCEIMIVFDAYKVKGNLGKQMDYHNIHVVYTKEDETADAYIERFTHDISKDYDVTVATSDGLIQLITSGQACRVISARELYEEVNVVNQNIREYLEKKTHSSIENRIF